MGRPFEDLSGNRYGDVTVIQVCPDSGGAGNHKRWRCRCERCGTIFTAESGHLKSNQTTKCRACSNKEAATKHGHTKERLWGIWVGMRRRCYNKNDKSYPCYGGRGIDICDEWGANRPTDVEGYEAFRMWSINNGYSDELTIDRIDNDKGYSPDNCRWATRQEQNNNTSQNLLITIDGVEHTSAEWSRISGINASIIRRRFHSGERGVGLLSPP